MAVPSLCEEETLEALARLCVAVALDFIRGVCVVRAIALLALPSRYLGMTVEILRAHVASLSRSVTPVTILAVAHGLIVGCVQIARVCIRMKTEFSSRAGTISTGNVVWAQLWMSIVPYKALVTKLSVCVVPAVGTNSILGIADISMAVTFALTAVGKVPVSWLTLVALPAKPLLITVTFARILVAELILGT